MNEPHAQLWNKYNSDVLPEFQLTYGHALFRALPSHGEWPSKLFKLLGLGHPVHTANFEKLAFPLLSNGKWPVLGSAAEVHFLFGRLRDVWTIFGPHDFFLGSKNWMAFNAKLGGIFALVTQMNENAFYYNLFANGAKQTNALLEGTHLRIILDTPITANVAGEKIYEDKALSSIPDNEVADLVQHDLAIHVEGKQLTIQPRFPNTPPVQDLTHFSFPRTGSKKGFLGIKWS